MVARLSPGSKIMLAYLFGPKLARLPSVEELNTLRPQDAVKVLRCGDMALASGHWRVLGESAAWDPAMWPVPQFLRRADALKRAWRVTYADADPSRSEREESVPYETEGLDADSLYGYGSAELLLTKLLEAARSSHQSQLTFQAAYSPRCLRTATRTRAVALEYHAHHVRRAIGRRRWLDGAQAEGQGALARAA
jgi:hypothetical protein